MSFIGPNGPIGILGGPELLSGTSDRSFRISIPSQWSPGEYVLTIGPNIRDQATGLNGGLGNLMDQNANGRKGEDPDDRYTARFTIGSPKPIDRDGPHVVSSSLSGTVTAPVSSIDLTFSESIDPASFTTADITFIGPNGSITALDDPAPTDSTSTSFRISFAPQSFPGDYSLTLGPGILDLAGNKMDQNQNGHKGEFPDDRYTTTFTIQQPRIVTIITHGLEPASFDPLDQQHSWLVGMKNALSDPMVTGLPAQDILIPNWAKQSNICNGPGWARAAGDKVFAQLMQKVLDASQPTYVHLIGHSRGAVVNSEAMRRLAFYEDTLPTISSRIAGVQMTTLDPVWVNNDTNGALTNLLIRAWCANLGVTTDDPNVEVWKHVDWADNYYQTFVPEFYGSPVSGAFNLDLTYGRSDLGIALPRFGLDGHSKIHDWYHWTIDTEHEPTPVRSYPPVDPPDNTAWYSNLQSTPGGEFLTEDDDWTTVGYNWSLPGNDWAGLGNPASDPIPVGIADPGTPEPIFNGQFQFDARLTSPGKVEIPGFESNDTNFRVASGSARLTKPTGRTPVYLKHALSFVPPDATALSFKIRKPVSGAVGTLSVLWANAAQCDQQGTTGLTTLGWVSLATQSFRQWQTKSFSLPGKIDLFNGGQVGCFVFQLEGARKQLRVELDDITLQQPQTGRAIAASFGSRAALEIASQHQVEGAEGVVRRTERDGTTPSGSAGTSDEQLGARLMITPSRSLSGIHQAPDVSHSQRQTITRPVPPALGPSNGHVRGRVWNETIDELLASGLERFDLFIAGVL